MGLSNKSVGTESETPASTPETNCSGSSYTPNFIIVNPRPTRAVIRRLGTYDSPLGEAGRNASETFSDAKASGAMEDGPRYER